MAMSATTASSRYVTLVTARRFLRALSPTRIRCSARAGAPAMCPSIAVRSSLVDYGPSRRGAASSDLKLRRRVRHPAAEPQLHHRDDEDDGEEDVGQGRRCSKTTLLKGPLVDQEVHDA